MRLARLKSFIFEMFRYTMVGGIAFLVDFLVLFLCKEFILSGIPFSLYFSTAAGFLAGLTVNYILCLKFVFLSVKNTNLGSKTKDKALFMIIGIVGLGMNELGMFISVDLLGIHYLIAKIIIAGIVMMWNYLARKYFIFNLKFLKEENNQISR